LILRKKVGEEFFGEIVYGDSNAVNKYKSVIAPLISENLLK